MVALLGIQNVAYSQDPDGMFTVYLARHAEKLTESENPEDPSLSACGESRAASLATLLRAVNLDRVYSTPYARTRETAGPVAASHQLEIETYDPRQLEVFSSQLLGQKQNALVIGHSNTTAVLAGLLSGEAGQPFGEDEFDRLYLVTVSGTQSQVNILDQAFMCAQQ